MMRQRRQSIARSSLLDRLYAYYACDELTGRDMTGRSNNLATFGSPTLAAGIVGQSIQAGTNNFLRGPDTPDLRAGGGSFAVAAWINPAGSLSNRIAVSKRHLSPTTSREWAILTTSLGRPQFDIWATDGTSQNLTSTRMDLPPVGSWTLLIATVDVATTTISLRIDNGTPYKATKNKTISDTAAGFAIGAYYDSDRHWAGGVDEAGFWKRVLTAQECLTLYNNGNGQAYPFRTPYVPQKPVVVFAGDSMTYGTTLTRPNTYPWQTLELMSGRAAYNWYNYGINGQDTTEMIPLAAADVDILRSSQAARNICVFWEGTNDLSAGRSAATTYNNIVTYCQARQAAGWKVIALTILPRSSVGLPGTFEADRQTVNTNIRANWATFADRLADVAADTRIGDAGDELDTTYYLADKVHMTATGYGVVAGIVKTELTALL